MSLSITMESKYIPMRDGTRLAATIFYPNTFSQNSKSIPIVWKHDRYHTRNQSAEERPAFERFKQSMLANDIAVALVDSRGSGASFGYSASPFSVIEQTDMYDVTEWFAEQAWCSGKIGMFGRSYSGISQYFAAAACPPHLTIIIPEMALFDLYQFAYPGGIFRHDFAREWGKNVYELDRINTAKAVDDDTTLEELIQARNQHNNNQDIYDLFAHLPYRDSRLRESDISIYETNTPMRYKQKIEQSGVVIFHIAGWQDLWVKDTLIAYNNLNVKQGLMIGPWAHNSYCDFLTDTITNAFIHYLKDPSKDNFNIENKIYYYTLGADIKNAWRTTTQWPLPNTTMIEFYFERDQNDNKLTTSLPSKRHSKIDYTIDYSTTSGQTTRWSSGYGVDMNYENLNELVNKSICFSTDEYTESQEITGHPMLEVHISGDSDDFDIFAFLIERHEDGYLEYVTEGCLRASRRKTKMPPYNKFDLPYYPCSSTLLEPVPHNIPILYKIDLLPISKIIRKGHTLLLCLCGADIDNCLTPKKLPEPTITIFSNEKLASRLSLPYIQDDN